jgi:tetratricopeptide (TPR) repeat protein
MSFPPPFSPTIARVALALILICSVAAGLEAQTSFEKFESLSRRAEGVLDTNPAAAVPLLREALGIRPAWAEGWFYLGGAYYQLGKYAEATDAYRKGVKLAPGVGAARAFLGLAEAELGNTEQALADIRAGEQLGLGATQQFEVLVRVKAARMLIEAAALDEALTQLQPLSRFNEDSPELIEVMGLCALAVTQKPSELSEERLTVVRLAGKAAWASASRRPADAAAAYKELLERYPNEPGVHYAHGILLMESDQPAAIAEFQKELELNPTHWPSLIVLASMQSKAGAAEEAVEAIHRAQKYVPARHRWLCHAELGRAYLTLDQLDQAIPEFEAATKLMPGNAQVHFLLAQAYRRAGRKEDAQRATAIFQQLKAQQDPLSVSNPGAAQATPKNN